MLSRGALGGAPNQQKPRSQNVNSVYSGKNTAAPGGGKASGPNKHGGLQALGKTTAIVRRMPPPATLPSLKAEHGQDPHVNLVPQGGQGWQTKSTETPPPSTANDSSKVNGDGSTETSSAGGLTPASAGPDLRPNWAKQGQSGQTTQMGASADTGSAAPHHQPTPPPQPQAPENREFPSLAAAAANKGSTTEYGASKPQKMSAWGNPNAPAQSSAQGQDLSAYIIPVTTMSHSSSSGYIGASAITRTTAMEGRKLPQRYCGDSTTGSKLGATQKYDWTQRMARLSLETQQKEQHQNATTPPAATMPSTDAAASGGEKQQPVIATTQSGSGSGQLESGAGGVGNTNVQSSEVPPGNVANAHQPQAQRQIQDYQIQNQALRYAPPPQADAGAKGRYSDESNMAEQQRQQQHPSSQLMQRPPPLLGNALQNQSGRGDTGYSSAGQTPDFHGGHPSYGNRAASVGYEAYPQQRRYDEPPPNYGNYRRADTEEEMAMFSNDARARNQQYGSQSPYQGQMDMSGEDKQTIGHWGVEEQHIQRGGQQVQRGRYDSRHTSESDSGWYGPLNMQQHPPQHYNPPRRGFTNEPPPPTNWGQYGAANQPNPPSYPPSLLTLDTQNPAEQFYAPPPGGDRRGYGYYQPPMQQGGNRSRNGSMSYDETQRGGQKKGAGNSRRQLGTELSSASENDSNVGGQTQGMQQQSYGDYEAGEDKTYWDRSSYGSQPVKPAQAKPSEPDAQQQSLQPAFRMLKRNDEKSAEYFAHHPSMVVPTAQQPLEPEEDEDEGQFAALSQSGKAIHKRIGQKKGGDGQRKPHNADHQQGSQNGGKFNRAPGRQQPATQQQHSYDQNRRHQQIIDVRPSKSASPSSQSAASSGTSKPSAQPTPAAVPVAPPVNVWEKRKEEQQMAQQSKPLGRQFDYHFPSMSDAAKQETVTNATEPLGPTQLFSGNQPYRPPPRSAHQDVRFDQQKTSTLDGGFGSQQGNYGNQQQLWNPPAGDQAESNWEDFAKETRKETQNDRGRRNQNKDEAPYISSEDIFSSNTYEGTRREFVNSSKSRSTISGARGGQKSARSADASSKKLSQSRNQEGVPNVRGAKSNKQSERSGPSGRGGTTRRAEQSKGEQGDDHADNFSNMDVFHADDYKIENDESLNARSNSAAALNSFSSVDKLNTVSQSGDQQQSSGSNRGNGQMRRGHKRTAAQASTPNAQATETSHRRGMQNVRTSRDGASGMYVSRSWRSGNQAGASNAEHQRLSNKENSNAENNDSNTAENDEKVDEEQTHRGSAHRRGAPRGGQSRGTGGSRFVQRHPKPSRHKPHEKNGTSPSGNIRLLGDRAGQLKSPVISDGGAEEWETASESSDFAERVVQKAGDESETIGTGKELEKTGNMRSSTERKENTKRSGPRNANNRRYPRSTFGMRTDGAPSIGQNIGNDQTRSSSSSISKPSVTQTSSNRAAGQKNVKPASHTYQGSAAYAKNSSNKSRVSHSNAAASSKSGNASGYTLNKNSKNARDGHRKGIETHSTPLLAGNRDGLAGVDINDASVIIIDNQPSNKDNSGGSIQDDSEAGDFEEVLSKKAKRQRLQQQEEERKKAQREKERLEKLNAKRLSKQKEHQQRRRTHERGNNAGGDVSKESAPTESPTPPATIDNTENQSAPTNLNDTITTPLSLADGLFQSQSVPHSALKKSAIGSPKSDNTNLTSGGILNGISAKTSTGLDHIGLSNTTGWDDSSSPTVPQPKDFVSAPKTTSPGLATVIPSPIARPTKTTTTTVSSTKQLANSDFGKYDVSSPGSVPGSKTIEGFRQINASSIGQESGNLTNDDHAQLQQRLDKVKNFWPIGSSNTIPPANQSNTNDVSDSDSPVLVPKSAQSQHQSASNASIVGPQRHFSGGYPSQPNASKSSAEMSTAISTPQSPLAATPFGNALFSLTGSSFAGPPMSTNANVPNTQPPSLTPYSASMIANGSGGLQQQYGLEQWFATHVHRPIQQPHGQHPATNPPSQPTPHQIIGAQPPHSHPGQTQRQSRPNSFIEGHPGFVLGHMPPQGHNGTVSSSTPWSTGGMDMSFLSGMGSTPPPTQPHPNVMQPTPIYHHHMPPPHNPPQQFIIQAGQHRASNQPTHHPSDPPPPMFTTLPPPPRPHLGAPPPNFGAPPPPMHHHIHVGAPATIDWASMPPPPPPQAQQFMTQNGQHIQIANGFGRQAGTGTMPMNFTAPPPPIHTGPPPIAGFHRMGPPPHTRPVQSVQPQPHRTFQPTTQAPRPFSSTKVGAQNGNQIAAGGGQENELSRSESTANSQVSPTGGAARENTPGQTPAHTASPSPATYGLFKKFKRVPEIFLRV